MFHFVPDEHAQEKEEDDMFNFSMSPYLNVYGFPAELDYDDIAPRPDNLVAVDAFCRVNPESWQVPAELAEKPGDKLIYVSLGSMGSIDVQLMKRITSLLAKTSHRYVVSKGQRGEEYDLPENCWGENFLPQTAILPLVDLVITHGGNNTVTETLSMGKPMVRQETAMQYIFSNDSFFGRRLSCHCLVTSTIMLRESKKRATAFELSHTKLRTPI